MRILPCLLIPSLLLAQSLPWPGPGMSHTQGSVSLLNTNTAVQLSTAVGSANMTVNAGGTNVVAFAVIGYGQGSSMSLSSVTYNGVAMTSAGAAAATTSGFDYAEVYYYINPPTGTHALAVTVAGTGYMNTLLNLVVFQGVNQTTPIRPGTYTTVHGNGGGSGSVTVTSNTHDRTLSAVVLDAQNITGSNQTVDSNQFNGTTTNFGSDHCTSPAASVTHTWSFNSATFWAIAALSIQPA